MFTNTELRRKFGRMDMADWGVWITHLCKLFEYRNDIDLHVVAPNFYSNSDEKFDLRGITYHLYQHDYEVSIQTAFKSINPLNLNRVTVSVVELINTIKPDLIHVYGTESTLYSVPALTLNKSYPCVLTVQRFNFMATGESSWHDVVIKVEDSVLKQFQHFGVRTLEMEQVIRTRNPDAKMYFHNYPVARPLDVKSTERDDSDYDVVFFARITRDKGIFDLIEAAKRTREKRPDFSVRLLGPILKKEEPEIIGAIELAGLQNTITYLGNEQDQHTLHRIASRARLCVLPTHADIVPGTIIESMLMKLPVVSYSVGGMPQLNTEHEERIRLVEKGDIAGLVSAQLDLLEHPETRNRLAESAYSFAVEYYSDAKVVRDIIRMYHEIV